MNVTLRHYTDAWSGSLYDDWTYYLIDPGTIEKKIEDDTLLDAGEILIQRVTLKLLYDGDVQTILESADESELHVFHLVVNLPESGSEKVVFAGALDLRTVEIDEIEKTVSFDIIGKLGAITLTQFGAPRQQNVNVYDSVGASSTDTVTMGTMGDNNINIHIDDEHGDPKDVADGAFEAGQIFEYTEGGTVKRFLILKFWREEREDEGIVYYDGVIKPQCPDNGTDCLPTSVYTFSTSENEYEKNYYGEDIYIYDSSDEITALDGLKIIKTMLKHIDTGANVNFVGLSSYSISRLEDFDELTFDTPEDATENLKELAKTCEVWLFVYSNGDYVIWSRFALDYGDSISADSVYIANTSPVKRYAMDIAKKVTIEIDGNQGVTGSMTDYNSYFFRGQEISKSIKAPYNSTDQNYLEEEALNRVEDYLDFYGKRREGKELSVILMKDDYFNFDLLDLYGSTYYVNGIEIDLAATIIKLQLIEKNGHTN